MNNNKLITAVLALCSLFAMVNYARAEEPLPDKFSLSIGGYALARFDSNVSLTEPNLGLGASISPQDTLGVNIENTVLRLEGYYRFKPEHALTYSWYSINTNGNKTLQQNFDWVDEDGNTITIPLGAQVVSNLDYDIFKVGYLWSFHHTDKVEIGVGAGLHITRLRIELNATDIGGQPLSTEDVDTTVPLPVISILLKYHITPKWSWYLKSEAFALKFDKWTGSYRDSTFGIEYRGWKHVALGAGLSANALEIEEDDPAYLLKYNNTIAGGLIYVATYF